MSANFRTGVLFLLPLTKQAAGYNTMTSAVNQTIQSRLENERSNLDCSWIVLHESSRFLKIVFSYNNTIQELSSPAERLKQDVLIGLRLQSAIERIAEDLNLPDYVILNDNDIDKDLNVYDIIEDIGAEDFLQTIKTLSKYQRLINLPEDLSDALFNAESILKKLAASPEWHDRQN